VVTQRSRFSFAVFIAGIALILSSNYIGVESNSSCSASVTIRIPANSFSLAYVYNLTAPNGNNAVSCNVPNTNLVYLEGQCYLWAATYQKVWSNPSNPAYCSVVQDQYNVAYMNNAIFQDLIQVYGQNFNEMWTLQAALVTLTDKVTTTSTTYGNVTLGVFVGDLSQFVPASAFNGNCTFAFNCISGSCNNGNPQMQNASCALYQYPSLNITQSCLAYENCILNATNNGTRTCNEERCLERCYVNANSYNCNACSNNDLVCETPICSCFLPYCMGAISVAPKLFTVPIILSLIASILVVMQVMGETNL